MTVDKAMRFPQMANAIATVGNWLQTAFSGATAPPHAVACLSVPAILALDLEDMGDALLAGPISGALGRAAGWLRGNGAQVIWEADADCAFTASITRRGITHLMVDVDQLGGIATLLEPLLALREVRPDLVVILVSHDFLLDDYGTERLFLCDASLRAPLSFAALEVALSEAAQDNNRVWMARRAA